MKNDVKRGTHEASKNKNNTNSRSSSSGSNNNKEKEMESFAGLFALRFYFYE